jgi:hypothetical protein
MSRRPASLLLTPKPLLLALTPLLLALAQCAPPPPPVGQTRADAATLAACREHADAVYNRQNRGSIYTISNVNSPLSANYTPEVVDRGLSQRYGYENMTRDCVRNTGIETNRSDTAPPDTNAPAPAQP